MTNPSFRALPSVDWLVRTATDELGNAVPHDELVRITRAVLAEARQAIGEIGVAPSHDTLRETVLAKAQRLMAASLRPVINATGVIIQTNLGRAPLSDA